MGGFIPALAGDDPPPVKAQWPLGAATMMVATTVLCKINWRRSKRFLGKSCLVWKNAKIFPWTVFGSNFLYQNWVGNSSIIGFWNHVFDHLWPFETVSKVEKSVGHGGNVGKHTPNRPRLYCTSSAFAAVLSNGRVVTWGNNLFGGDSGAVQDQLRDVRKIESTLGKTTPGDSNQVIQSDLLIP